MDNQPSFDPQKLSIAFASLKAKGLEMQAKGEQLVGIAESGLANVAPITAIWDMCSHQHKGAVTFDSAIHSLSETGSYAVQLVSDANRSISGTMPQLNAALTSARLAVSHANIGSSATLEKLVTILPEMKEQLVKVWPPGGLRRSFTDEDLDNLLSNFDPNLPRRRQGAWQTFRSHSSDAVAQASHSMRDILAKIIAKKATNAHIESCDWYQARKREQPETKPTMTDRVRFLLRDTKDAADGAAAELEKLASSYVEDDGALKKTAHGSTSHDRRDVEISMKNIEELLYVVLSTG